MLARRCIGRWARRRVGVRLERWFSGVVHETGCLLETSCLSHVERGRPWGPQGKRVHSWTIRGLFVGATSKAGRE